MAQVATEAVVQALVQNHVRLETHHGIRMLRVVEMVVHNLAVVRQCKDTQMMVAQQVTVLTFEAAAVVAAALDGTAVLEGLAVLHSARKIRQVVHICIFEVVHLALVGLELAVLAVLDTKKMVLQMTILVKDLHLQ